MKITVNGEPRDVPPGTTAESLVRLVGAAPEATVVERNREILERGAIAQTALEDGDVIELVRFVGGG